MNPETERPCGENDVFTIGDARSRMRGSGSNVEFWRDAIEWHTWDNRHDGVSSVSLGWLRRKTLKRRIFRSVLDAVRNQDFPVVVPVGTAWKTSIANRGEKPTSRKTEMHLVIPRERFSELLRFIDSVW